MQTRPTFSCFLIGNDSLLMECGDLLVARGQELKGVATNSDRVRAWARSHELECVDAEQDLGSALSARAPFDWLLSIAHLERIPSAALAIPQRGVINFHDGPLPKFAGRNAPVWAVWNGETEYGIGWHFVTEAGEEGPVLVERSFPIAP
ncbi:MAG: formyltransferase family protein, partial [Planctomycetota bacterium]|nr:formyltransferase family protein [Planctomycetota bacterium]